MLENGKIRSREAKRHWTVVVLSLVFAFGCAYAFSELTSIYKNGNASISWKGTDIDKGAFVRLCLTTNPTIRVADIERQAASHGLKIAWSYISDLHKALLAERDKQAQQETA